MNLFDLLSIYALWLRDVKRFLRTPSRIVGSVAMPLLFLVFLAFGFSGAAIPGLPEGVDYLQFLVPGMVGFTMLFGASFAGLSILSDQDVGFLKEILVPRSAARRSSSAALPVAQRRRSSRQS